MNILPKKSWHVRNKDNIAKVRRDEENARLEEEKLAKRAALAEQEARTKLLRDRVHGGSSTDVAPEQLDHAAASSSILPYGEPQTGHVNLFEQEEIGGASLKATNTEYEAEKKAEQEKKEKALGVLKYLGQSVAEEAPWYLKKTKNTPETKKSDEADRKKRLDPLEKMNTFLEKTKKSDEKKKPKKDTNEKKDKHKREQRDEKTSKKPKKKTIEELRAERLQREKQERFRAEKLIQDTKKGISTKTTDEEDPYSSSNRRYHSQYNPDFARKPKFSRYQPY